jgi:hypothetical protein
MAKQRAYEQAPPQWGAPKQPQKNSTLLKLQPPLLTNLKKEKGFFFF